MLPLGRYIDAIDAFADADAGAAARPPPGIAPTPARLPPPPYLRLWHYERDAPWLADAFALPDGIFDDKFETLDPRIRPSPLPRWIFVGPVGTYTPLHVDPWETHAWFAQVRGRKRFAVFPPACLPALVAPAPGGSGALEFADLRRLDGGADPAYRARFPGYFAPWIDPLSTPGVGTGIDRMMK